MLLSGISFSVDDSVQPQKTKMHWRQREAMRDSVLGQLSEDCFIFYCGMRDGSRRVAGTPAGASTGMASAAADTSVVLCRAPNTVAERAQKAAAFDKCSVDPELFTAGTKKQYYHWYGLVNAGVMCMLFGRQSDPMRWTSRCSMSWKRHSSVAATKW